MKVQLAAAIILCLSVSADALACESKADEDVLFDEAFTDDIGGWNFSQFSKISPEGLEISLSSDNQFVAIHNISFNFMAGDHCVTFTWPQEKSGSNDATYFSLHFLAYDYKNYYAFSVGTDGNAGLLKSVNGKYGEPLRFQQNSLLRTDPGSTNELRAIVKWGKVKLLINGQEFKTIKVQTTGAMFGVSAFVEGQELRAPRIVTVRKFSVTKYDP